MWGHFMQARTALRDAISLLSVNQHAPSIDRATECFQRYLATHKNESSPTAVLDTFIVLLNQGLQHKGCQVDPLVLFSLQFGIASRLSLQTLNRRAG